MLNRNYKAYGIRAKKSNATFNRMANQTKAVNKKLTQRGGIKI